MSLASISSIITVIIAILLCYTRRNFTLDTRLASKPFSKLANALVAFSGNIYLAIPSLVLGLGFFLMYQKYDAWNKCKDQNEIRITNILANKKQDQKHQARTENEHREGCERHGPIEIWKSLREDMMMIAYILI